MPAEPAFRTLMFMQDILTLGLTKPFPYLECEAIWNILIGTGEKLCTRIAFIKMGSVNNDSAYCAY